MGVMHEGLLKVTAIALAWTFGLLMSANGIDSILGTNVAGILSGIPVLGWVFSNPMTFLAICVISFIMLYNGMAVPRWIMKMLRIG